MHNFKNRIGSADFKNPSLTCLSEFLDPIAILIIKNRSSLIREEYDSEMKLQHLQLASQDAIFMASSSYDVISNFLYFFLVDFFLVMETNYGDYKSN